MTTFCARLLPLLIFLAAASAQSGESPTLGLRFVGSMGGAAGGAVSSLSRIDDRTVLSDGGTVFDLADPAAPRVVGKTAWAVADFEAVSGVGYLASRSDGLTLVDARAPYGLPRLGGYRISGGARSVEVSGSLAYVASGDSGLRILDASNPALLDQVGVYPRSLVDTLFAADIRVRSDLTYVAAGPDTLEILRVGYPDNILRAGGLRTGLNASFMDWMGARVLVAGETGGVQLIDVTTPTKPVLVGSYPGSSGQVLGCHGVRVSGNLSYVAAGDAGVVILDWSDPTKPVQAGRYATTTAVVGVNVLGGRVLACHGDAGFEVLDLVTNAVPAPVITGQPRDLEVPVGGAVHFEVRVEPVEGMTYQWLFEGTPLAGSTGAGLDFKAATAAAAGSYSVIVSSAGGSVLSRGAILSVVQVPDIHSQPTDVARVEGESARLWVGARGGGTLSYQWYHDGEPVSGAVGEALDLVALSLAQAGEYSVRVGNVAGSVTSTKARVHVAAKMTLRQVGRWPVVPTGDYAGRLRLVGDRLYVAMGFAGLVVLDVSDPTQPRRVGGHVGAGYAYGLDIVGDRLYLADGVEGGLVALDISVPDRPVRLGSFNTGGTASDVRVEGNFAYVALSTKGMAVINISKPSAMLRVGAVASSYGATGLDVSGSWVYVADSAGGLLVVDVADVIRPLPVVQYSKSQFGEYGVHDVRVVGSLAFVPCTYDGFRIADVTDPRHPVTVGYAPEFGYGVQVDGSHAYVGGYDRGLWVYDWSVLSPLLKVGSFDTPGEVNDVEVGGKYVYVADGKDGVVVLEKSLDGLGAAPRLEVTRWGDAGAIQVRCPGAGAAVLQRSLDLKAWSSVRTNSPVGGQAWVEFTINDGLVGSGGFYRAVR